jgi:hypothetical protein
MVEAGGTGAHGKGIAEQEAPTTAQLEHVIARSKGEGREDRAPREVVNIFGAVHRACAGTGRTPGNAVREPIYKDLLGETALPPRGQVLLSQSECAQGRLVVARLVVTHPIMIACSGGVAHP